MPEPRDPSLQVVMVLVFKELIIITFRFCFWPPAGTPAPRKARGQRPPLGPPTEASCFVAARAPSGRYAGWLKVLGRPRDPLMIPPLVHQRRPCYDFYFL
jgi:hypothetical protein